MAVGNQPTTASIDQDLSQLATQLRDWVVLVLQKQEQWNKLGLTGLESLPSGGFASAANPANPGGVSDAQLVLNYINYLATVAGVANGTVQAQGTGGTGASLFNFLDATCLVWLP